jgi:Na+/serine symporter
MYTMISPSPIVFFLFVESTISGKKKAKKNNFLLYIILYMHHFPTIYYFIYASLQKRNEI